MSTYLPTCRHRDPKSPPGVCELQPGVLICPCLGRERAAPVASLSVDEAGQLVWRGLSSNDTPTAHFTLVALRLGADGRPRPVRLKQVPEVPLNIHERSGYFSVQLQSPSDGDAEMRISIKHFMEQTLRGEETVLLEGR